MHTEAAASAMLQQKAAAGAAAVRELDRLEDEDSSELKPSGAAEVDFRDGWGSTGPKEGEGILDKIFFSVQSFLKGISAEWAFLIIGLFLEIFSVAFDQAACPSKPYYVLYGMLLAIAALVVCICELIYKGIKERVEFKRWGILWWFYHPHSPNRVFGTLPEIYGLVGGMSQCASSIVQFVCFHRRIDNPIKVSLWPVIFLICLAASRFNKNRTAADTIKQNV